MLYRIQPNQDGTLPQFDSVVLADELQAACGCNYGLSTAGTELTLYTAPDDDEVKITQVIEAHLAVDAATRRANQVRAKEIAARLEQIDAETIRPLRAHIAGTATAADEEKLKALEDAAGKLRTEFKELAT